MPIASPILGPTRIPPDSIGAEHALAWRILQPRQDDDHNAEPAPRCRPLSRRWVRGSAGWSPERLGHNDPEDHAATIYAIPRVLINRLPEVLACSDQRGPSKLAGWPNVAE